jgi:Legionella pneumophila major outer membrane protein precursor
MVKKHLASVLLSLGAISPFVAHADQPAQGKQMNQKRMAPQFDMGDPIEPGTPGHPGYVPAAYNYPAAVRAPNQDWDVFLTGTFIYWKAEQDNMFTGVATDQANPDEVALAFENGSPDMNNTILFSRKPNYKPGFKVGLGWNTGSWDNWVVYGEYTWYHTGEGKDDDDANPCGECGCAEVLLVPTCNCPDGVYAKDLESKWKLDLDIGDLIIARPAYQGKRLVLSPFFGIRGLWIRQKFGVNYDAIMPGVTTISSLSRNYFTEGTSKGWSVGPRIGVDGSWLFGCGFRIVGNASASLLYTRYTHFEYKSNIPNGTGTIGPAGTALLDDISWQNHKNYGTVRPNFEMDAGLGWGTYIGDMYHFDLEARYDFHVFFAQNMIQDAANWAVHWVDAAPGNLYLHGLTIKARFDF